MGNNIIHSFSYSCDKSAVIQELRIIAAREGKSQSELITCILEEYVKNHAEGNSTFKLDTWQDNQEFKAIPTLLTTKEKWVAYLKECNDKELTDISIQTGFIREYIEHKRKQEFLKK